MSYRGKIRKASRDKRYIVIVKMNPIVIQVLKLHRIQEHVRNTLISRNIFNSLLYNIL